MSARIFTDSNPFASAFRCDSNSDFEKVAQNCVGFKQDAGLTAAFARQLEHVFAKTYRAEFPQYRATEFFPLTTEVDAGALSFTYRMIQRAGQAAVVDTGTAKDLPNISLGGQEWPQPIITIGATYDFTVIDQASAMMAQFALEAEKAQATRDAIAGLCEQIFAQGYAAAGVPGVVNAPGVAAVTQVSTGGTWTAQLLAATSPLAASVVQGIANDLIAMKQAIFTKTLGRHQATNVLLPTNLYSLLDTVPQSPLFNNRTLLGWLEDVTKLDIDYWPILLNAGSVLGSPLAFGNVSAGNPQQLTRVVVYEKNPEVMQLVQAAPFTQLAPQPTGLAWEIPCYERIGGAMSIRPLGIVFMDGL
jgi:hypothetical protein